ncbi:MAG: lipocalin-like domain-containing protein, partial [Nitrospiraceae bacterium]
MNTTASQRRPWWSGPCLVILCLLPSSGAYETGNSFASPTSSFRQAEAGYSYIFPRDHGAHEEYQTEWWYYTGHLSTAAGRQFGYQLTFFRRALASEAARTNPSRWAIRQLYLAHFALSDLDRARFRFAEKISRAGIGKAGADAGRLRVWIDRWSAEALTGTHEPHHLEASTTEFSIDLVVNPEKPPIVHGRRGISRKGDAPGQASHYYSLTRLGTTGTVTIGDQPLAVRGTSWMDHEFSSSDLGEDLTGWDWFSIQLDNQMELMLYQLRREDGGFAPASSGTMVYPDGDTRHLSASDFAVDVLDRWTSQTSGARYPSRWRVTVFPEELTLELVPRLAEQELMTERSTRVTYWEGAVGVAGTQQGASIEGQGYVELTGYAQPLKQR